MIEVKWHPAAITIEDDGKQIHIPFRQVGSIVKQLQAAVTTARKNQTHDVIVRDMIDEVLEKKPEGISIYWLQEEIQNRIHPTQLFNVAIAYGQDTDDGIENLRRGAELVVAEALDALPEYEVVDNHVRRAKGKS